MSLPIASSSGARLNSSLNMIGYDIINATQISATTFVGDLSGNVVTGTADKATNIAGGLGGQIPYQSAVNTTALLANGLSGQVLQSNGTTLPPSWVTPAGAGSTVTVTDTNTAGTYYPTFVSASGSGQTLRADITTTPLSYNPNTNTLNLNGIDLNDNAGTNHISKLNATWFGTTSVNSTNLYQTFVGLKYLNIGAFGSGGSITPYTFTTINKYATTHNSYTSSTDAVPLTIFGTDTTKTIKTASAVSSTTTTLLADTGASGGGSARVDLNSSISNAPTAKIETYNLLGDYSSLQLQNGQANILAGIPAGEDVTVTGCQFDANSDVYYLSDGYASSTAYVSRITVNGWTFGYNTAVAPNYPNPPVIDSLSNIMTLSNVGLMQFGLESAGIQNRTTTTSLSSGNPLTLTGGTLSFKNYNVTYTGTTNTISSYSFTSVPLNAVHTISIYNAGTGNLTFNGATAGSGATRVGGSATVNSFVVPTLRYAICELKYTTVNSISMYFLNFTLM
jgi:hypothetical protein